MFTNLSARLVYTGERLQVEGRNTLASESVPCVETSAILRSETLGPPANYLTSPGNTFSATSRFSFVSFAR